MKGKGLVEFKQLQDEVAAKLEQGWPIKALWEEYKEAGKFSRTYRTFLGYVWEFCGDKTVKAQRQKAAQEATEPAATEQSSGHPPQQTVERKTTSARVGTTPKFDNPTGPAAQKQTEQGDGPVVVTTFDKHKTIRPGKKGVALDEDELI